MAVDIGETLDDPSRLMWGVTCTTGVFRWPVAPAKEATNAAGMGVVDIGVADIGAADIGAADMGPADVGAAGMGAGDIGVVESGSVLLGTLAVNVNGFKEGSLVGLGFSFVWGRVFGKGAIGGPSVRCVSKGLLSAALGCELANGWALVVGLGLLMGKEPAG